MINKKVTGIILLAGNSTRYNSKINKNFELLNNKPLILYSLNAFVKNKNIFDIILVIRKKDIDNLKKIIFLDEISKPITFVVGGKTRKESVCNALKVTNSDIVVIHDAARPLIKQEYINECVNNMDSYKGVSIAVKSKDTIKITGNSNEVINTTIRDNTWIVQTPQCFDRKILLNCHIKFSMIDNITDDCMLLEKDNYKVKLIPGDYTNIKVTTREDLFMINEFLKHKKGDL